MKKLKKNTGYLTGGTTNLRKRTELDFYSTDPLALQYLLENETFDLNVWECACGNGALSKVLEESGYNVLSSDLVDRGYGQGGVDFLMQTNPFNGDIITNPPFNKADEFVLKALELSKRKVAIFCRIQFLESRKRYENIFSIYPPIRIYVFVNRVNCFPNGESADFTKGMSGFCYAWFIWDKYNLGKTELRWIYNKEY